MTKKNILWILPPIALAGVLLGGYLWALPTVAKRAKRTPCTELDISGTKANVLPSDIMLTDLDGKPVPVSSFKGRLVLLNFWLTTCQPCLEELPSLLRLAGRYKGKGLTLLMVSTDKKKEDIVAFVKKVPRLAQLGDNALILHDPGAKLANKLGTTKFPETYLVGPDLAWQGVVVGPRDWASKPVTACIGMRLP